ncbi:Uncharacterised protein [BD1-7 clade bacterium]|uniref:Uncharacterized protein n=1 Tax=BD1-7 clade bacterium TaxID=2029982 RepID=A0A5S9R054_9GAMM|nr:Uncharacterised protein [BD1-7 clade bacterium]
MISRTICTIFITSMFAGCSPDHSNSIEPPAASALAVFEFMRVVSDGSVEGVWLIATTGEGSEHERSPDAQADRNVAVVTLRTVSVTRNDTGDAIEIQRCNRKDTFLHFDENTYIDDTSTPSGSEHYIGYTFSDDGTIYYAETINEVDEHNNGRLVFESERVLNGRGFKIANAVAFDSIRFEQSFVVNAFTDGSGEQFFSDADFDISCIEHSRVHNEVAVSITHSGVTEERYGGYTESELVVRAINQARGNLTFVHSERFSDVTRTIDASLPVQEFILDQYTSMTLDNHRGAQFGRTLNGDEAIDRRLLNSQRMKTHLQYNEDPLLVDIMLDIQY